MSQTPPTTLQATARTLHQMYQGMKRDVAETRSAVRDGRVAGRRRVSAIGECSGESGQGGTCFAHNPLITNYRV
jgi:hypothetical protein